MELTPDALRETTFRGALRGYNVDDVDEFVEKVAAGMAEILDQLRLSCERAVAAERRAKEVATSEDAMRRTLAHAQKLAEAVLDEARQEAERITTEAKERASSLRAGIQAQVVGDQAAAESARQETERILAQVRAEQARDSAAADTRRVVALGQIDPMVEKAARRIDTDLQAEIQRLHAVRQALQVDVAVLTRWMHDQRDSVRNVLVETLAAVDRGGPAVEPPPVSDIDTTVRLAGIPVDLADTGKPEPDVATVLPPVRQVHPS